MNIPLCNFESEIDEQIMKRGKSYYRKGAVIELEQDGENWHAVVAGSDEYTVDISMHKGEITDYNCTCPYDLGPLCKHEVAVFYSIRDGVKNGIRTVKTQRIRRVLSTLPKTIKIRDILQSTPQTELVDFVTELAEQSLDIQRLVVLRFSQEVPDKKIITTSIKQAFRQASDRHGFLDYWSTSEAADSIQIYVDEAKVLVKQQKYSAAIPYYQALIEVAVPMLQHADDSNGELGGLIETSFEELTHLAVKLSQIDQKKLFEYCLLESKSNKYDGWGEWQIQWLEIATLLINTSIEQSQLFKNLDELITKSRKKNRTELLDENFELIPTSPALDEFDSYLAQQAALLKYQVIVKRQGKDAGVHFLIEHQHLSDLKQKLIEYYIKIKKYSEAKQLAEKAYVRYLDSLPGLAIDFAKQLVIIAQYQQNNPALIKWASIVFLGWGDFDYFYQMKKTLDSKEWFTVVEHLLQETGDTSKHAHAGIYVHAKILAEEHRFSDLYHVIVSNPEGCSLLSEYESVLKADYPEGIADIYEAEIQKKLQGYNLGRSLYQEICRLLRRIKKLGFSDRVENISTQLQTTYPKRLALLDELSRI